MLMLMLILIDYLILDNNEKVNHPMLLAVSSTNSGKNTAIVVTRTPNVGVCHPQVGYFTKVIDNVRTKHTYVRTYVPNVM
jgi:hypothetical protein